MLPNNAAVGPVSRRRGTATAISALKEHLHLGEPGRSPGPHSRPVKSPNHSRADPRLSIRRISVINNKQWPREAHGLDIVYKSIILSGQAPEICAGPGC